MKNKKLFIFDMDGVLLDSEPYWRKSQIDILQQFGVTITINDCINNTMGKRIDDISKLWIDMFRLEVTPHSFSIQLLNKTAELISYNALPRDGVYTLINYLKNHNYRIALATSSSTPIILAVLQKLNIESVFEFVLSADEVENGKPAPDVYLEVCKRLKIPTSQAIALEDSITGVKAAVAANITTIAIPEHFSEEFKVANYIIDKIEDVINVLSP